MIVYYGQISSFMINPNGNGLHPHVTSHATEFELALALIFKTGSTLLVHHWQPGGLELDNHCLYQTLSIQITVRLLSRLFFLLASSERRNRACLYYYVRTLFWQTTTTVYKNTVKLQYTINNHIVSGESIINVTLLLTATM